MGSAASKRRVSALSTTVTCSVCSAHIAAPLKQQESSMRVECPVCLHILNVSSADLVPLGKSRSLLVRCSEQASCVCCGAKVQFAHSKASKECTRCQTVNLAPTCSPTPCTPSQASSAFALKFFQQVHGLCEDDASDRQPITKILAETISLALSTNNYTDVISCFSTLFASPEAIVATFCEQVSQSTQSSYSIDFGSVKLVYNMLLLLPKQVQDSAMASLTAMLRNPHSILKAPLVSALLVVLENPLFVQSSLYDVLQHAVGLLAHVHRHASDFVKLQLVLYPDDRFSNLISKVQQFLAFKMFAHSSQAAAGWHVQAAVQVLKLLFEVNERTDSHKVVFSRFYNQSMQHINILEDYSNFISDPLVFSFCKHAFVVPLVMKREVLETESRQHMMLHANHAAEVAVFAGIKTELFLSLQVNRATILQDSLAAIAKNRHSLKKYLKVEFQGEPGLDYGGLTKEWFLVLSQQVFLPAFGVFVFSEETRTFWFRITEEDNRQQCRFVGNLLGMAINNSINLDISLPLCCYKKLLGIPLSLQDLCDAMPALGAGLQQLLDFDGNVQHVFMRSFDVTDTIDDINRTFTLKPNGSDIAVTNANREEFVNLYVDYKLNTSVTRAFDAFFQGFHEVCGGRSLSLLRAEELEALVCGCMDIDVEGLKRTAVYDQFDAQSKTITLFWEVMHEMDLGMKRQFLRFVTGSDRAPIRGTAELKIKITRVQGSQSRLPMSHTCFNQLCLCEYASKDALREALVYAITNSQSFELA